MRVSRSRPRIPTIFVRSCRAGTAVASTSTLNFSDRPSSRRRRRNAFGWALREGPFKLVQVEGAKPRLYDLSKDPIEVVDLLADGTSSDEAAIVAGLEARFTRLRAE